MKFDYAFLFRSWDSYSVKPQNSILLDSDLPFQDILQASFCHYLQSQCVLLNVFHILFQIKVTLIIYFPNNQDSVGLFFLMASPASPLDSLWVACLSWFQYELAQVWHFFQCTMFTRMRTLQTVTLFSWFASIWKAYMLCFLTQHPYCRLEISSHSLQQQIHIQLLRDHSSASLCTSSCNVSARTARKRKPKQVSWVLQHS